MKRLKNKVAIITGAASGMGRAEAKLFSKHGAKLVITDINWNELKRTASEIEAIGGTVIPLKHDVTSEEDWNEVIKVTDQEFRNLHILVNNAGIIEREGLENTSLDMFILIQNVNLTGTFLGMKFVVPLMKRSQGGSIINISSVYGIVGSNGSTAYHASKGAVRSITKAAAVELSKYLIRVNSIHPGLILTPMSKTLFSKDGDHPLIKKTPWPEIGSPEDIAYGALYLASDESKFVTGSELVIDGGFTAQ